MAISLHAPDDELRDEIVPINKKYNIETFLAACRRYIDGSKANEHVTVEYVMLNGINDSMEQAEQLAKTLKGTPSKINLIPFNPYPGSRRIPDPVILAWIASARFLQESVVSLAIVPVARVGDDIDAACGQLVGDVLDRTKRMLKKQSQKDAISVKMV